MLRATSLRWYQKLTEIDLSPIDPVCVAAARKAAGQSTQKAADLLGISRAQWARYEGARAESTSIPPDRFALYLLLTDQHPDFVLTPHRRDPE